MDALDKMRAMAAEQQRRESEWIALERRALAALMRQVTVRRCIVCGVRLEHGLSCRMHLNHELVQNVRAMCEFSPPAAEIQLRCQ
jgi:hypothetical protein